MGVFCFGLDEREDNLFYFSQYPEGKEKTISCFSTSVFSSLVAPPETMKREIGFHLKEK